VNPGPHRPELWAKYGGAHGKVLQIGLFQFRSTSSQIHGFYGRFPGFGSEIELLPRPAEGGPSQLSDPRGASHLASSPLIAAMRS
jgi:hypothetical protein